MGLKCPQSQVLFGTFLPAADVTVSLIFFPHGYVSPRDLLLLAAFDLSLMRWPHYSFVKFLPKNGTLCSDFLFMSHSVTKRAAATLRSWFIASTPCWERLFLFFGSIHILNFYRGRLNSYIFLFVCLYCSHLININWLR